MKQFLLDYESDDFDRDQRKSLDEIHFTKIYEDKKLKFFISLDFLYADSM